MNFALISKRKIQGNFRRDTVLVTDKPDQIDSLAFIGIIFNRFHSYIEIEMIDLKYSPVKFESLLFKVYFDSFAKEAGFKQTNKGLYTFPVKVDQNTSDVLEVVKRMIVNLSNVSCNLCLVHSL